MMMLIRIIKSFFHLFKVDIVKYPKIELRQRKKLFKHHRVTTILDVGANSGQYAKQMFKLGFQGKIISFEPVKPVFKVLVSQTKKKSNWEALNIGLGDKEETVEINVSENTFSSSILEITENHVKGAPKAKVQGKTTIEIKKLDTIFSNLVSEEDRVVLKMDVQGFEKNVLLGAEKSLEKIHGIQIEMSLEEMYEGEMLFHETLELLTSKGFELCSLENEFYDEETGKLFQLDGIFFRTESK